jgi:hypothetical protein
MTPHPLPAEFVTWLTGYIQSAQYTNIIRLHRGLILRWTLWADGLQANAIPGYDRCPPASRSGFPAGWHIGTFRQIAKDALRSDTRRTAHKRPCVA